MIKSGANNFIGRTSTDMQITFAGVDLATKIVSLYSFYVPTKQPISGILTGNWLKSDFGVSYGKDVTGAITGTVTTDQTDPTGEITLTWQEDFLYITDETIIGYSRDVLRGMLSGQVVTFADGTKVAMLGVSGNYKTATKANASEINREWGNLLKPYWGYRMIDNAFEDDANFEPKKVRNSLINPFLLLAKPFMIENYSLSGDGTANCRMMPSVVLKTMSLDEGDFNTNSIGVTVLGDTYELEENFNSGFDVRDYTEDDLTRLTVDYIVSGDSVDITAPVNDETACIIDPVDGTFEIMEYTGTWVAIATGSLSQYATIFANKSIIATVEEDGNCFVSVKEASLDLTGQASSFVLDSASTVKNFICKAKVYDLETRMMIPRV